MKKTILMIGLCAACFATQVMAAEMVDDGAIAALVDARMKALDTNGDGKISKDEYWAAAAKKFVDNDTDHDGMLSKQELMAIKMKEIKELTLPDKK